MSDVFLCIQVWSADAGVAHSPPSDLLWKSQTSWGTGNDIVTTLINADDEVKTSIHLSFFIFLFFRIEYFFIDPPLEINHILHVGCFMTRDLTDCATGGGHEECNQD